MDRDGHGGAKVVDLAALRRHRFRLRQVEGVGVEEAARDRAALTDLPGHQPETLRPLGPAVA